MEDKEDRRSGWDNLGIWGTSGIHTGRAPVSLRIGDVGNSKDIDHSGKYARYHYYQLFKIPSAEGRSKTYIWSNQL